MRYDQKEARWYTDDGGYRWNGGTWEPVHRAPRMVPSGRSRRPWIAATTLLGVALLAAAGLLFVAYSSNAELSRQLAGSRGQSRSLSAQNRDLEQRLSEQQAQTAARDGQITQLQGQVTQLQSQVRQLEAASRQPTLGIWNVPQRINSANDYSAGGVPDTFTYHIKLSSTAPISVSILTFGQFVNAAQCVRSGGGSSHYCMHHSGGQNWPEVTDLKQDFHEAEGCAGYLMVITAAQPATVTPDVSVTYNPAPHATGACA